MVEIKGKKRANNQSRGLNRKRYRERGRERVYYIGVFLYMVLQNKKR